MMKSMEKYISEVYEKYAETENEHIKYKTVKMRPKKPLKTLCSVIACLVIIGSAGIGIKNHLQKEENISEYVSSEVNEKGNTVYTRYLTIDTRLTQNRIKTLINKAEKIIIASDFQDDGRSFEYKNGKFLVKTNATLKVEKVLKDDNLKDTDKIKCYKYGGDIALNELKKEENYDWEIWELEQIGFNIPEEEEEKIHFNQIPTKGIGFESDKQYLVFLMYDEENEIYAVKDIAYGIMEYDPSTNMVKNIDTGEFEEFDWSLITKENNK